jgi:hypothetical protein
VNVSTKLIDSAAILGLCALLDSDHPDAVRAAACAGIDEILRHGHFTDPNDTSGRVISAMNDYRDSISEQGKESSDEARADVSDSGPKVLTPGIGRSPDVSVTIRCHACTCTYITALRDCSVRKVTSISNYQLQMTSMCPRCSVTGVVGAASYNVKDHLEKVGDIEYCGRHTVVTTATRPPA